jgi:hypothetical protein
MRIDIFGGIVTVTLFKDRAVTVGTLIGASPARYHRGAGRTDIAEQGQMVSPGKSL